MTDSNEVSAEQKADLPVFEKDYTFRQYWFMLFFRLSGDRNQRLHSMHGKRVVQGAAVITQISTMISEVMPGYMPRKFQGTFEAPVYVGDTVHFKLM